jgi:DNA-binding CsgD family transcriptional regulator
VTAGHATIDVDGADVSASSGPPGSTQLECAIRVRARPEDTPLGSGVNYWLWAEGREARGMACAFTSRFLEAEPVRAGFAPDSPYAHWPAPQLLWAGYMSEARFDVSSPYVLGRPLRFMQPAREAAYLALIGELGLGAVALRPDGTVLFANAIAQSFAGDGLAFAEGRVFPSAVELHDALIGLQAAADAGRGMLPIALPRPSGRKPLIVQAFPMRATAGGLAEEPLHFLLITDPGREKSDPIRALQLLGLTPAEARIAALVGSGLSPREAAELAGNSEGTVRTTLKQVYEKLDIGRQSELARLVARLETTEP